MGKSTQTVIGIIIAVSVILRVVSTYYLGNQVVILPGTHDQLSYHKLALRVLEGHGFTFGEPWWPATGGNEPTAMWSYLYTLYLVIIYSLFGPHPQAARLIQAIIVGILQPLLVYLIARRIFGDTVGLVAAALTALYAYFIYYAATLMTEPFYITSILGALYLAIRMVDHKTCPDRGISHGRTLALAIGLGLALGIAVLLRQLFLLLVPFIFLWVGWASRKRGGRSTIPALLIAGFLIAALILPFTYFNYTRFGRFVLLNTNAGYAFFWANHPIYGTRFEPILPPEMGSYQSLLPDELRGLDEATLDQALLKRGLQFVIDEPGRYVLLSLSRIPAYFMFWPSSQSPFISNLSRVVSFGLLLPFMIYGIYLALSDRYRRNPVSVEAKVSSQHTDKEPITDISTANTQSSNPYPIDISSPTFLLILFVLIYTTIHLLSWALIRYRLPVDAVLLIFAALALVDLALRLGAGRWFSNENDSAVEQADEKNTQLSSI